MRISIAVLFMFMVLVGCKEEKVVKNLAKGNWLVELELMDNQVLPFNLKVEKNINIPKRI